MTISLYMTLDTKFVVECGRIVGRMSAIEKKAEVVFTFLYIALPSAGHMGLYYYYFIQYKYSLVVCCCVHGAVNPLTARFGYKRIKIKPTFVDIRPTFAVFD